MEIVGDFLVSGPRYEGRTDGRTTLNDSTLNMRQQRTGCLPARLTVKEASLFAPQREGQVSAAAARVRVVFDQRAAIVVISVGER